MPLVRRASLALSGIIVSTAIFAAFLSLDACSFDWSVNADAGDASVADATKPSDATTTQSDGSTQADASSPTDAGTPDEASCAMLETNADAGKANAVTCVLGALNQCTTTVADQCGCQLFVTYGDASATTSYAAAVQALATSGCPLGCPPSSACPTLPVTSGCTQQGGSTTATCVQ
jgi:hypothetical protein